MRNCWNSASLVASVGTLLGIPELDCDRKALNRACVTVFALAAAVCLTSQSCAGWKRVQLGTGRPAPSTPAAETRPIRRASHGSSGGYARVPDADRPGYRTMGCRLSTSGVQPGEVPVAVACVHRCDGGLVRGAAPALRRTARRLRGYAPEKPQQRSLIVSASSDDATEPVTDASRTRSSSRTGDGVGYWRPRRR